MTQRQSRGSCWRVRQTAPVGRWVPWPKALLSAWQCMPSVNTAAVFTHDAA